VTAETLNPNLDAAREASYSSMCGRLRASASGHQLFAHERRLSGKLALLGRSPRGSMRGDRLRLCALWVPLAGAGMLLSSSTESSKVQSCGSRGRSACDMNWCQWRSRAAEFSPRGTRGCPSYDLQITEKGRCAIRPGLLRLVKRCLRSKCSFELHLDAILLHGDVTNLVDLAPHRQVLGIKGVKRLIAQQLLPDHRADLLQPLGIPSA